MNSFLFVDQDGCQFTAAVARKPAAAASSGNPAEKPDATREKTREKILRVLAASPEISMVGLTEQPGISAKGVEWQIREMKKAGILKRIGQTKAGNGKSSAHEILSAGFPLLMPIFVYFVPFVVKTPPSLFL